VTDQQADVVIFLLQEIVDRLDAFAAMGAEPEGCQHPEDKRIELSSMGDPNHWVCKLCRFDNKATATV
jgi:hypothetical protein